MTLNDFYVEEYVRINVVLTEDLGKWHRER
jgi:hypothetical protein